MPHRNRAVDELKENDAMARYEMLIDVSRCIGCYNCFLACRDEYAGNDHLPVSIAQPQSGQAWMAIQEHERGAFPKVKMAHVPVPCLHCREASCVAAATGGAVYRREDGIVLIDPEKAVGQRKIVSSCPYRVIFWNEEKNVPQKCTFCAHLLDAGWKEPRCVEACPTRALVFGIAGDPNGAVAKLRAAKSIEELHPEYGMRPSVNYLGLPKRFVAGEIVLADAPQLPAAGVSLSLRRGAQIFAATTDNYGDFEFDGLETDVDYVLSVAHPGYQPQELKLLTGKDLNVGSIVLEPLKKTANARKERF
jgi:Fe-S-cluster-containing dehydrogenase component